MKKGKRKLTITVTPQTLYHLERMATAAGYRDPGPVVDKLVAGHQIHARKKNNRNNGGNFNGIYFD